MSDKIEKGPFHIAMLIGEGRSELVNGYRYKGLGMHRCDRSYWIVSHIWTGFKITEILAPQKRALILFKEIASLGDWSMMTFDGWKNFDPALRDRVRAWRVQYPETCHYEGRPQEKPFSDVEYRVAAKVADQIRELGIGT